MKTISKDIQSLMNNWNKTRKAWIETFGNDNGFQEWFTKKLNGK